ncbi:MAG: hypothetical protein IPL35_08480 [Sphingobacteriales bacterium]|nr:hypothetical protein [Sphingobacteriales bacterium]
MKIQQLFALIICLLIECCFVSIKAQDTSTLRDSVTVVMMKDGSVYQGKIVSEKEDKIQLQTKTAGILDLLRSDIKTIEKRVLSKTGQVWFPNPNYTRYFFGPTAFCLQKGESYYQNTYLIINTFNYGITNYFTIGGGIELISLINGEPIFMLNPKLGFPLGGKWAAGGGVLYINSKIFSSERDFELNGLGIGYGLLTYGSHEHNMSLGVGYGWVNDEIANQPILTVSGMTRVSKRLGLVSENWFLPIEGSLKGLWGYGGRIMGENLTVDLGFIYNREVANDIFKIGFPYIDLVVRFGKKAAKKEAQE